MTIDGLVQGGVDVTNGLSVYEYSYAMMLHVWGTRPDGRNALVIGLGAGIIPSWLGKRGVRTDVVDIDPVVVDAARRYFDFHSTGEVFLEDARSHLARSTKAYDYVVLDVFNGDTTPGHVLSREALELVRNRMAPEGILAVNLIGSLGVESFMTASVIRTLQAVFRHVEVFTIAAEGGESGIKNFVLLARDLSPIRFDPSRVDHFPIHPMAERSVRSLLGKPVQLPEGIPAIVLTDDYNPIDFYDRGVKELVRWQIVKESGANLLL
jgi:spermidine synthase